MTFMHRSALGIVFLCAVSVPAFSARAHDHARLMNSVPNVIATQRAAHEMFARGQRASIRLTSMLGEARLYRDARRMQCLDSALTQVNSLLRLIEMRIERMSYASEAGDERLFGVESGALRYASEALLDAESGVSVCIAGNVRIERDGITRVEMIVDPDVPRGER